MVHLDLEDTSEEFLSGGHELRQEDLAAVCFTQGLNVRAGIDGQNACRIGMGNRTSRPSAAAPEDGQQAPRRQDGR